MASAVPQRSPAAPAAASPARDPAREAWRLFYELALANKPTVAAALVELDLSMTQAQALRALQPGTGRPMSELARHLMCDSSNVTGVVDRLEARGLLERGSVEHDRRVKALRLTAEGERLRSEVEARLSSPPAPIADLPAADRRALRDILRRALDR